MLPALLTSAPSIPWRGVATIATGVALALLQRQIVKRLSRSAVALASHEAPAAAWRLLPKNARPASRTVIDSLLILWRRNGE